LGALPTSGFDGTDRGFFLAADTLGALREPGFGGTVGGVFEDTGFMGTAPEGGFPSNNAEDGVLVFDESMVVLAADAAFAAFFLAK
jgi:hypothetical protein